MKIVKIILYIFLVVLVGFYRETFFVRIAWYEHAATDESFAPSSFPLLGFLENLSFNQLQYMRYIGTFVFTLLFWLLALLLNKWFFQIQSNNKISHFIFAGLFAAGVVVFLMYKLFPKAELFFELSRWILQFIQSPLCILFLLPVFLLRKKAT
jgi:hypothetical protein